MGDYKSIVGAISTVSSIVKYSVEDQSWQIYTRWKNGAPKFSLRRKLDTIPFNEVSEYTTFIESDVEHRSGLGRAIGFGILFGGVGAVVGAITGHGERVKIKQIGFALKTNGGDEYVVPLFFSNSGERPSNGQVKVALNQLDTIDSILRQTGVTLNANWHTDINGWFNSPVIQ
ncbi:hypothetical protein [Bifidobacterium felsineum]|uniref:Uncharacterized protein n=1 Tax=Bifidobacterium felsineum TaxID=2045440 RepID=A0A2M9HJ03_9BIFI|nr:hypothetical protein [Bifidobacterium felsineum]MBT1164545.1 hypothetical protein [Bifidobacterium felsineum]PJM76795.1 hypothetical protein CSQ86_06730 [Bifidobacterium felsineum]